MEVIGEEWKWAECTANVQMRTVHVPGRDFDLSRRKV